MYSLGRLRAPAAATQLLASLRDPDPATRPAAARALTRELRRRRQARPATVADVLARAADDKDPGVRINALRSLGTYRDSSLAPAVAWRVDDPVANVRVQAAATLGELGGSAARAALLRVVAGKGTFALRREALLGLARADSARVRPSPARAGGPAGTGGNARRRREGWALAGARGVLRGSSPIADGRVVAAGLQAWAGAVEGPDAALARGRRRLLTHRDAAVRSVAADVVARAADPGDLPALTAMYGRSARDSFPDAAIAALNAIAAIGGTGAAAQARVEREFLRHGCPGRRTICSGAGPRSNWPEAATRWGPAHPIATGRSLQDYRDLVRRFVVAPDSVARPHVIIETEQRGHSRGRAVRSRGAAHRGQLPAAGRSALLRRQPLAPGGAQLRGAGWRSPGRRVRRPRRRHPGRDQSHRGTTSSRCWAWRCRVPTPARASGSSL